MTAKNTVTDIFHGLTVGEALIVVKECLKIWWSKGLGHPPAKRSNPAAQQMDLLDQQVFRQLAGFINRHGDTRFSERYVTVSQRAGWFKKEYVNRVYYFNSSGLREALKGLDFNESLHALVRIGALPKPCANGRRTQKLKVDGKQVRVYPITLARITEAINTH